MKNTNNLLIVAVIVLLISNLFFGYMFFFHKGRPGSFDGRNFPQMQLTDEQINNVKTFFESTTDINKITEYCDENRVKCFYYCRNINSDHEYCSQLMQKRPDSSQTQRLN